ncbi:MAG TPA: DMT family transporter [Thermomicrobiales bacterium]|nr:DMT family transporter [Thermomicrobiales bacterium]
MGTRSTTSPRPSSRIPRPDPTPDSRASLIGPGLIVISGFGFGAVTVLARVSFESGSNAPTSLALRFGLAVAIFWLMLAARRRVRRLPARRIAGFALMGLLFSAGSTTSFMSVERIPAALAAHVFYIYPAIVTLRSAIFFKTRFPPSRLLVLLATLLGCALTVDVQTGGIDALGLALAISTAFFYSGCVLLGGRVTIGVPPLNASAWIISFASGLLVVVGAFGVFGDSFTYSISTRGGLAILGLAIFSTVISLSTFLAGMARIDVFRASIISTIEPVVSVARAAWLLSERLTMQQTIGGVVIVGSAITLQLVSQREGRRRNAEPAAP